MAADDELRTVRRRLAGYEAALRNPRPEQARGTSSALGTVVNNGHMPTTVPGVFAVTATDLSGDDTEGASWTSSVAGGTFTCTVLGAHVPLAGDVLPMDLVGNRWVAERAGGCTESFHLTFCEDTTVYEGWVAEFTQAGQSPVFGTVNSGNGVTAAFPSPGTWAVRLLEPDGSEPAVPRKGTATVVCGAGGVTVGMSCPFPRVLTYRGRVSQAASSFYFNNVAVADPEPTYTLTYKARPLEIPKELQLLFFSAPGGVLDPWFVTMPDTAWFSEAAAATVFGTPTDVYFYGWFSNTCQFNVMVIDAPYGLGAYPPPDGTRGAGNNVLSYVVRSFDPFAAAVSLSGAAEVTGVHGADDVDAAKAGAFCCPRTGSAGGCLCP